jgi:mannan endo-1,4-beta-mannosidase
MSGNKYLLRVISIALTLLISIIACSKKSSDPGDEEKQPEANDILVDSLATEETVALFKNLRIIAGSKVLFGHQDDLAYGVGWWAEPGSSDVKAVCGDYPAVYGWDLGDIHEDANLDGVDFNQMREWIKEVYSRGGINTVSMHLDNPVTSGNAWDNSQAVASILPGMSHHTAYINTLEMIADFLKSLKASDGTYIPIIFRPYHEHNHGWSWWGANSCTVEEYNALWRMTVEYLRDEQQIHHLLYAISPQETRNETAYLERYPGDDYVDIFGMDYYKLWNISNVPDLGISLQMIATLADNRGKVAALTEVGVENVPYPNWWTDYLLASIKFNDVAQKVAWTLVWRNAREDHFFGPYPGHASTANFITFYNDSLTVFENDLPGMYK